MDSSDRVNELLEVMKALETYLTTDPIGMAELATEAETYAKTVGGCSQDQISFGVANMSNLDLNDPKVFECFGHWFAYMRNSLIERGLVKS